MHYPTEAADLNDPLARSKARGRLLGHSSPEDLSGQVLNTAEIKDILDTAQIHVAATLGCATLDWQRDILLNVQTGHRVSHHCPSHTLRSTSSPEVMRRVAGQPSDLPAQGVRGFSVCSQM